MKIQTLWDTCMQNLDMSVMAVKTDKQHTKSAWSLSGMKQKFDLFSSTCSESQASSLLCPHKVTHMSCVYGRLKWIPCCSGHDVTQVAFINIQQTNGCHLQLTMKSEEEEEEEVVGECRAHQTLSQVKKTNIPHKTWFKTSSASFRSPFTHSTHNSEKN